MKRSILFLLLLVILLSSLFRAVPIIQHENIIGYDVFYHMQSTEALIEKGFFSYDPYGCQGRILNYPPGFHVFLAILSPIGLQAVVQFLPIILSILSILTMFVLARHMFNEKVGLLAAAFMTLNVEFVDATITAVPQAMDFVLIPAIFYLLLRYIDSEKKLHLIPGFLLLVTLSFIHPMGYIVAFATLFIFFLWEKQKKAIIILVSSAIPIILWSLLFILPSFTVPLWGMNTIERFITSFGSSLLILPILGIIGLFYIRKIDNQHAKLAVVWLGVTLAGCLQWVLGIDVLSVRFLPFLSQALALLAAVTVYYLYSHRDKVKGKILAIFVILLLIAPTIYTVPYFTPIVQNEDFEAISWIKANTPVDADIATTLERTGMFLPYYVERKTLTCAYRETVSETQEIGDAANYIYKYDDDTKALEYLEQFGIDYIYFTELDKQFMLWKGFSGWERFDRLFEKVFENEYVKIYKV